MALVSFLRHFRYYLLDRKLVVRSDYATLKRLRNFKDVEGMFARWLSVMIVFLITDLGLSTHKKTRMVYRVSSVNAQIVLIVSTIATLIKVVTKF